MIPEMLQYCDAVTLPLKQIILQSANALHGTTKTTKRKQFQKFTVCWPLQTKLFPLPKLPKLKRMSMNQSNRANAQGKLKKKPSVRNATLLESFLEPLLQSMASSMQALSTATEHSILQCTAVLLVAM